LCDNRGRSARNGHYLFAGGRTMSRSLTLLALVLVVAAAVFAGRPAVAAEKCDLPLVFEDNFEKGADHWQPTDAAAWRIVDTDRGKVYNQFKNSKYEPPYRSPYNISSCSP
jgi:hypothetical protein